MVVYIVKKWDGVPTESEEMSPKWYSIDQIPYSQMWADDSLWLPSVLDGKKVKTSFLFNDKDEILEKEITIS